MSCMPNKKAYLCENHKILGLFIINTLQYAFVVWDLARFWLDFD